MVATPFPDALVDFLRRYRLATAELLAAEHVGLRPTPAEATRLLETLSQEGCLRAAPLVPGDRQLYYTATAKAAKHFGDPDLAPPHLAVDERLALWAIARFATAGERFRQLMTAAEFAECFPDLSQPGEPRRYYLEQVGEVTRLAFLKVDLGGASHWDRVVDSCLRFINKRLQGRVAGDLFRQLLEHDRFQVSLLVACEEKAEAIQARLDLDAAKWGAKLPVVPYVVPGLFDLLIKSPLQGSLSRRQMLQRRRTA
jgi:hypothetical protein